MFVCVCVWCVFIIVYSGHGAHKSKIHTNTRANINRAQMCTGKYETNVHSRIFQTISGAECLCSGGYKFITNSKQIQNKSKHSANIHRADANNKLNRRMFSACARIQKSSVFYRKSPKNKEILETLRP